MDGSLRKALLILFVFVAVAHGAGALIGHAWENYYWKEANPLLEQVSGTWVCDYPNTCDYSLASMKAEDVNASIQDQEIAGSVLELKNARPDSIDLREKCIDEMEYAKKSDPEKYLESFDPNVVLASAFAWSGAGMLGGIPGVFLGGTVGTVGSIVFSKLKNDEYHLDAYLENCGGYLVAWDGMMAAAADSVSLSMDAVERNYSSARESFSDLSAAGMCDQDYAGPGKQECLVIGKAFDEMNSGTTSGAFGSYNSVHASFEDISGRTNSFAPDMSNYSIAMNLIWKKNGVLDMLNGLRLNASKAKNDSLQFYAVTERSAGEKRGNAETKLAILKSQKLGLITEAETVEGGVSSDEKSSISEIFWAKQEEKTLADARYSNASNLSKNSGRQGYLKDAISNMKSANSTYTALAESLPELESSAERVVEKKRDDAAAAISEIKSLISATPTIAAVRLRVNQSESYYYGGESAQSLGDKYAGYSAAEAAAREAKTLNSMQTYNFSVTLATMKAELREMIAKARSDGISTVSQETILESVEGADYDWAIDNIKTAEEELAQNAKSKYCHLEMERAQLLERIRISGAEDADLLTTIANAESGFVNAEGDFDYKKGIGRFAALSGTYSFAEKQLDGSAKEIASHSISASTEAQIDFVSLDTPSNITFSVLLANTNEYAATDVPVEVSLPMPAQLMYSDIAQGSDIVSSVAMKDGNTALIYLKKVEPYAKRMVVFDTSQTLAHTAKSSRKAVGLGDGSASVSGEIEFTLDTGINALKIPPGMENAMIDGNAPGKPLSKGSHTLSSSYVISGAYNESMENVRTTPLGLNSQVDYEIALRSAVDLDSAVVFIDPGTSFSNLNVFTLSSESVGKQKKITESRYSYEIAGLRAGKEARIRVSYTLENATSYAELEIALMSGANYSEAVQKLVADAKSALESGDSQAALSKIQQAKAQMKKEDAEREKAAQKVDGISKEIGNELSEISSALANTSDSNASIVTKLQARQSELKRRLADIIGMEPENALAELGEIDLKWKENQVKAYRKAAFDEYNKLRLRFAAAGNSSTPPEFLEIETALNEVEVSGRLECAMELAGSMKRAESLVQSQESAAAAEKAGRSALLEPLKASVRADLKKYSAEAEAAKGTEFSQLFAYSEKEVEGKISELDKLAINGEPELFQKRLEFLNSTATSISGTLSVLATQSEGKMGFVRKLLNDSRGSMDSSDVSAAEQKIESMEKFVSAGQYINALRLGNKAIDDINAAKKGGTSSLLLLGITALAVLAVLSAYILKQQDFGKKPEDRKTLKKLDSMEGRKEENTEPVIREQSPPEAL